MSLLKNRNLFILSLFIFSVVVPGIYSELKAQDFAKMMDEVEIEGKIDENRAIILGLDHLWGYPQFTPEDRAKSVKVLLDMALVLKPDHPQFKGVIDTLALAVRQNLGGQKLIRVFVAFSEDLSAYHPAFGQVIETLYVVGTSKKSKVAHADIANGTLSRLALSRGVLLGNIVSREKTEKVLEIITKKILEQEKNSQLSTGDAAQTIRHLMKQVEYLTKQNNVLELQVDQLKTVVRLQADQNPGTSSYTQTLEAMKGTTPLFPKDQFTNELEQDQLKERPKQ